jgi:SAM-dependent methyltransferase
MNDTIISSRVTGSAQMQGDLWSARARDYAELQERHFLPLYESVQRRPELAKSRSCLDVGCGPGLAVQVFSQTIANVAGIDASAAFIDIARERLPGRNLRVGEMETLPHADGSFDVVTGFNAFQYAASPVNALRGGGASQSPWCVDATTAAGSARAFRVIRRIQIEGAGVRGRTYADSSGRC